MIDKFLNWIYTASPAAWISAFVALIALIRQWRKRPNRLVVQELEHRSLDELRVRAYEIHNEGSDLIDEPSVTFRLTPTTVHSVLASPEEPLPQSSISSDLQKVTVTVPYFNPYRPHKQTLSVLIRTVGEAIHVWVMGGGKGWSVRYVPHRSDRPAFTIVVAQGIMLFLLCTAAPVILNLTHRSHLKGIEPQLWTAATLAAGAAVAILHIIIAYKRN